MFIESYGHTVFETTGTDPFLTVAIPTRNRWAALCDLLDSLDGQTLPPEMFEVLIVDDGGDASLRMEGLNRLALDRRVYGVVCHVQENAGPAVARNRMIDEARGGIILFLNDDVTLEPNHLAAHLARHQFNPDVYVVVRGITRWAPLGRDNAVMRYLRRRLFVYEFDLPPGDEHIVYFHTCDLSLKRDLLRRHRFDERFPTASFEDSELGYRLSKEGNLRLILANDAVSHHHHDYTGLDLIRRARVNGRSAALFIKKYPELRVRLRDHFGAESFIRRLARAGCAWMMGRSESAWEEIDNAFYVRALDQALSRRDTTANN